MEDAAGACRWTSFSDRARQANLRLGHGREVREYAEGMADGAESIRELDVAAMVADMGPRVPTDDHDPLGGPTADDVPIALDGTRLDTPSKLIAYLEEINATRKASNRQRAN